LGRFRGLFSKRGGCDEGCGCNDCGDTCGKRKFGGRLRGLFHKGGNDCCESSCGTCATASCGDCCDSGCGKQGLFGRLRGLFRKGHGDDCCGGDTCCDSGCGAAGCGTPAPAGPRPESIQPPKEQPKKMPATTTSMKQVQIITPEAPKAILTSETETKNPFELSRRYDARVSHAPDYSCLTGQLFYVHADGGLWVLRYAPLWKEDPNGGSIVLARDLRMGSYQEGDLVTVHGEIVRQKSSVFLGGPLYHARTIELIERSAK